MNGKLFTMNNLIIFLAILFFNLNFSANAQQLDSNRIKAAYIINFIKHISWPNDSANPEYRFTVYKDQKFYNFLVQALRHKIIKSKPISLVLVTSIQEIKSTDIVYIAEQYKKDLHKIANALRGSETLLISDGSKQKHDVMINLVHNKDSAAISFEVNKSNIVYEKLSMSVELLLLGGTELDVATLYHETEMAMQHTIQQDEELRTRLLTQKLQLERSKKSLKKSKQQLSNSMKETSKQKIELAKLKNNVVQKQNLLVEQELKLKNVSTRFKSTEQKLSRQQQVLAIKEQKNQQILQRVAENNAILNKQKKKLANHKIQLKQQDKELLNRNETINNQQQYILITTVLITIAVFVSLLMIFFFIKNKRTTNKLAKTLTYLENTQEQLIQSEKMASLGGLVAGVAHEINTPLSIAITSNSLVIDDTSEVKQKISDGCLSKSRMAKHIEKVDQSLSMSEKALERVRILLANFKQVAADQIVDDQREINLAEYIEEVMMTLSVEMKKHHVNYSFSGDKKVEITTLPGAFAQVLTNFVNNSIKHGFESKENGNISISLTTNDETIDQQPWAAKITYQDDGLGMTAKVLKNIFEPFFTTKRGKGNTGLGMNIVYNIIHQKLKGNISIISEPNSGATFIITLPQSI